MHSGTPVLSGSGTGVLTNLHVTDTGVVAGSSEGHRAISLFKISDTEIVGLMGQDTPGDSSDDFVALRILLSAGPDPVLTVEQYLPLEHPLTGTDHFDKSVFLNFAIIDGELDGGSLGVTLTDTVTDGDGDTSTNSQTVTLATAADSDTSSGTSLITFEDDGPSLNIVDAPNSVNETQSINGTWTLAEGTDGVSSVDVKIGATTHTLSIPSGVLGVDPVTHVTFTGADVQGGTLDVYSDGTWTYTAGSISGGDKFFTFSITATDGDGDQVSDSQTITIHDTPDNLQQSGTFAGLVEEEQLGHVTSPTYAASFAGNEDTTAGPPDNDADTANIGAGSLITREFTSDTFVVFGGTGPFTYHFAPIGIEGTQAQFTNSPNPMTSHGATGSAARRWQYALRLHKCWHPRLHRRCRPRRIHVPAQPRHRPGHIHAL